MIRVSQPFVGEEEIEAVSEVLRSGRYLQGPRVEEFEQRFAEYVGATHGIAVSSGTAALHISLAAHGIGPGDEVIVPPLTFFSSVTAVLHQHAIPVFADIDPGLYCLDPEDVRRRVTDRTRAIMPVHLFGCPADMDGIQAIAAEFDLIVIEDCAQAHGASYRGRGVGSMGAAGCFSFYATKNMTTGEGGMIVTNDEAIAGRCRLIRSHGMTDRDTHRILGYNYRMTEMAGAMGVVQLGRLPELNRKRTENSEYLLENLADVPWLKVPTVPEHVEHVYFWCPVQVLEQKLGVGTPELVALLRERGVEVRQRYSAPLYRQPLLTESGNYPLNEPHYGNAPQYGELRLPVCEQVCGRMIGLPNHPGLSRSELDTVLEVLHGVLPEA